MTSHANCPHPSTKAARAACRRGKDFRSTAHSNNEAAANLDKVARRNRAAKGGPKSLADACDPLAIDRDTLDDRIRAARRRPTASPVKVSKVEA